MAADDLASQTNNSVIFRFSFMKGQPAETIELDCLQRSNDAEYILSQWYYDRKALGPSTIMGLAQTGCIDGSTLRFLAVQWNILSFTSVDSPKDPKDAAPTSFCLASMSMSAYVKTLASFFTQFHFDTLYALLDTSSPGAYRGVFEKMIPTGESPRQQTITKTRVNITHQTPLEPLLLSFSRVSRAKLRRLMVSAYGLNMTGGQYVYVAIEPMNAPQRFGLMDWRYNQSDDEQARLAFKSLFVVELLTLESMAPNHSTAAFAEFQARLSHYNDTKSSDINDVNRDCYATVMLFGQVMMESHANGAALTDGQAISKQMRNRTFHLGKYVGDVFIDAYNQRTPDVLLTHFEGPDTVRKPFLVLYANASASGLHQIDPIEWIEREAWPPPNRPPCGYGDRDGLIICDVTTIHGWEYSIAISGSLLAVIGAVHIVLRRIRYISIHFFEILLTILLIVRQT
ncbi:hypothetical protein BV898_13395 [Hypsibius exemplaris]|uniref:Receptor ligand binding region domain-containing protein n=1 Tax=Hypsibius exemplaris TaxID=2072580 RepID=A0A1W0WB16_HYPEX|nr:hypothetical protein BV898_13395 [Hypsibius exemplaris]